MLQLFDDFVLALVSKFLSLRDSTFQILGHVIFRKVNLYFELLQILILFRLDFVQFGSQLGWVDLGQRFLVN